MKKGRDSTLKTGDRLGNWIFALGTVGACTVLAHAMFPYFALVNLIMVYIFGTVLVSLRGVLGPSILACLLSVLTFDFFFVPPRFTLAVASSEYLITFFVMLAVSLILGSLVRRVRLQAEGARRRERRTASLFQMSQDLVAADGMETILGSSRRRMSEVFESEVEFFLPDKKSRLLRHEGPGAPSFSVPEREKPVAQWAFDLGQRAGRGTETLPDAEGIYVPLNGVRGPVGVARVRIPEGERPFDSEQMHLLEAFAHLVALAVENEQLKEQAQESMVQAETEKLRSSILSSVSHDLRTPLSAILGSASGLLGPTGTLTEASRRELAENIHGEAERLSRLLGNLLEMTRLQAGVLKPQKEPQPLEEVVGSALTRLEKRLGDRPVLLRLPPDLPMIAMDGVLMEQVFLNLFDNVLKHSPESSPLEVEAGVVGDALRVEVLDRGPGLPRGEENAIFEKFHRGPSVRSPGAGLGLAICKGMVEIHGGRIEALSRDGGGAVFRMFIPLGLGSAEAPARG